MITRARFRTAWAAGPAGWTFVCLVPLVLSGCVMGPRDAPPFTGDPALPHAGDVLEYEVRGSAPFLSPLVSLGYPADAGNAVIRATFAAADDRLDTHLGVHPSFVVRFEAVGRGRTSELGAAYLSRTLPFGVLQLDDRTRLPSGSGTYHDIWDGTGPACFFGNLLHNASAETGATLRATLAFNTGATAPQALELRVVGNETSAGLPSVLRAETKETPHPYRIWTSKEAPCPVRVEGRSGFFDPTSPPFEIQLRSIRRGTGGPLTDAPANPPSTEPIASPKSGGAGERGFPPDGDTPATRFPLSEAWERAHALDPRTRDFLANHSAAFLAHAQRFEYTYQERWGVRWTLELSDPDGAAHRVEIGRQEDPAPGNPLEDEVSRSEDIAAPPTAGRAAVLSPGRRALTLASAEEAFHAVFPAATLETVDVTPYGDSDMVRYAFRFNPTPEDPGARRSTLEFDATTATLVAFTGPDAWWAR